MANSSIIGKIKNKIIRGFIKDKEIIQAIDSPNIESPEKLIGTHIFDFHQNPFTINDVTPQRELFKSNPSKIIFL